MKTNNNKNFFTVTIDVEADNVWSDPSNLTLKNLRCLVDFQRRCDKYNIIPSYLLSYETLSDGDFISFLKDHLKERVIELLGDFSSVKKDR